MKTFFDSSHCLSAAHCLACRKVDAKEFRASIARTFADVTETNFECPHNKPWGYKPKIKLVGNKIYKGKRRCRSCENRRNKKLAKQNNK